jgi:glutathione peroxidase
MIVHRLFAAALLLLSATGGFAMSAFDFEFTAIDGKPMPMAQFKGKPVLVVNTASQCGYTPQYDALQKLYDQYKGKGLVVLGVPSNDFGAQEPGSAADIKKFCETSFGIEFPMTEKYQVIGPQAHPLYRWIAAEAGEGAAPKWNFHKYLIAPDGSLAEAWPSRVAPLSKEVTGAVEKLLAK